jgi:hypothetical protein
MFTSEHRRAVISVALALQGALVLMGAVLVGFNGTLSAQLDNIVGAEASVAAIVLGAAFILAFRTPNRTWVNLAIMYEVLAIIAQLWKNNGFTMRPTWTVTVISGIFLICFVAFYPRTDTADAMQMTPAH